MSRPLFLLLLLALLSGCEREEQAREAERAAQTPQQSISEPVDATEAPPDLEIEVAPVDRWPLAVVREVQLSKETVVTNKVLSTPGGGRPSGERRGKVATNRPPGEREASALFNGKISLEP